MEKKGLVLLITLLVVIPSCGWRKKSSKKTPQQTAQRTSVFSTINLPVAELDDADKVQSFFDDEFVAFANDDFDLEAVGSNGPDEFSWLEGTDGSNLEVAYFDFNKDSIRSDEHDKAKRNAQKVKRLLESNPDAKVVVNGHTCQYGARTPNIVLSERRARNYADFLKANGIPENRLAVVGRGKEMLIVKGGTKDEWWPNRRVELHIDRSAPAA